MFIDCIKRHLAICAYSDLASIAKRDKNFWNVITIMGPGVGKLQVPGFLKKLRLVFEDVREEGDNFEPDIPVVTMRHAQQAFEFVDSIPGEPVLIHCLMGVSRSPAMAMAIILRGMAQAGLLSHVDDAVNILLSIRPQAKPNPLVLKAGLACFLPYRDADELADRLLADERFKSNSLW
jgi:predicted protein tyrosine phosphatase